MSRPVDRDINQLMQWTLRLHQLQEQKAAIEAEEAALKAQIRGWSPEPAAGEKADGPRGGTLSSAAAEMINANPDRLFTAEDVKKALEAKGIFHDIEINSLRSTLARLAKNSLITNVRRGYYQSARKCVTPVAGLNGTHPMAPSDGGEEAGPTH